MTAADDNRVVQGLWVGSQLSALERLCIRSYCAHGHEFHLYHYDELQNAPRIGGLLLFDAREILPRTAIFRHRKASFAYFADHFRFELLRQRGGWWADMDTVCVRPLDFSEDIVFACGLKPHRLMNHMLKFPRGHELTAAIADSYKDVDKIQPWDTPKAVWHKMRRRLLFWRDSRLYVTAREAGGMISLMSAVRHFRLDKYIQPESVFLLPGDLQFNLIFKGAGLDFDGILRVAPQLRCVHFCHSGFNAMGVNKDGEYPQDSVYEILKRRYPEPASEA